MYSGEYFGETTAKAPHFVLDNEILYLLTCFHSSPEANYKVSSSEESNKTNTLEQKIKQGKVYHLDNNHSISATTPTMMR
jgi:hypothetical protein